MSETHIGDFPLVQAWMVQQFEQQLPPKKFHEVIALMDGDQLRGAVWLESYNGVSVTVHIAGAAPGWITRTFLRRMFGYVFNDLGCRKMLAPVRTVNQVSVRLVKGLGFRCEHTVEDADPEGGISLYTLTRENCKYLEK